jgi:hypothetical protein
MYYFLCIFCIKEIRLHIILINNVAKKELGSGSVTIITDPESSKLTDPSGSGSGTLLKTSIFLSSFYGSVNVFLQLLKIYSNQLSQPKWHLPCPCYFSRWARYSQEVFYLIRTSKRTSTRWRGPPCGWTAS